MTRLLTGLLTATAVAGAALAAAPPASADTAPCRIVYSDPLTYLNGEDAGDWLGMRCGRRTVVVLLVRPDYTVDHVQSSFFDHRLSVEEARRKAARITRLWESDLTFTESILRGL